MKQLILCFITLTVLFITSCTRYYYKPNPVNVPLFTKGGQAHVNIFSLSGSENEHGYNFTDLQACVSPVNHIGIIANYNTYSYTTTQPDFAAGKVAAKSSFAEVGVGAYHATGGEKHKMVLDIYAGGGSGNFNSDVDMRMKRLFIQPGIGLRSSYFDIAFATRISRITYFGLDANGRDDSYLVNKGLIDIVGNEKIDGSSYTFFEPCITMRGGYKYAKLQLQLVLSTPMSAITWNYNPVRASAGLYITVEEIIAAIRKANR